MPVELQDQELLNVDCRQPGKQTQLVQSRSCSNCTALTNMGKSRISKNSISKINATVYIELSL